MNPEQAARFEALRDLSTPLGRSFPASAFAGESDADVIRKIKRAAHANLKKDSDGFARTLREAKEAATEAESSSINRDRTNYGVPERLSAAAVDALLNHLEELRQEIVSDIGHFEDDEWLMEHAGVRHFDELVFRLDLLGRQTAEARLREEVRLRKLKVMAYEEALEEYELGTDRNLGGGSKPKIKYIALAAYALDGEYSIDGKKRTSLPPIKRAIDLERRIGALLEEWGWSKKSKVEFTHTNLDFDFRVDGEASSVYNTIRSQLSELGRVTSESTQQEVRMAIRKRFEELIDKGEFIKRKFAKTIQSP